MNKRLIWNFLLLPLGLLAAIAIAFLLGFLLSLIPYQQSQDAFIGGGYEWFAVFIGIALIIGVIGFWTIRIIGDIISFRKNRKALILNIGFLLLIYAPPFYIYVFKAAVSKVQWFNQRESITTDVVAYKTISVKADNWIVGFQNTTDTTYLFMKSFDAVYPYRKLYLNKGSRLETEMSVDDLHIYSLDKQSLREENSFKLDTIGYNAYTVLDTKLPRAECIIYHGDDNHQLILNEVCLSNTKDTLKGFNIVSGGAGYNFFIDNKNNYWFLFYTPDQSRLFVGMSNPAKEKKVYRVTLSKSDEKMFHGNNIKTIVMRENRLYVIAKEKILYFEI